MEISRQTSDVGEDLLEGADAIARFLFGDQRKRKRVYHLAEETRGPERLPSFKMGGVLCARKSTIRVWIEQQEAQAQVRAATEKDIAPQPAHRHIETRTRLRRKKR